MKGVCGPILGARRFAFLGELTSVRLRGTAIHRARPSANLARPAVRGVVPEAVGWLVRRPCSLSCTALGNELPSEHDAADFHWSAPVGLSTAG